MSDIGTFKIQYGTDKSRNMKRDLYEAEAVQFIREKGGNQIRDIFEDGIPITTRKALTMLRMAKVFRE